MKESLISIIVPIFNVEKYVAECIESIQKQTYQNIQIILVDDGSEDKSGVICDEYAAFDRRIEVIHKKNGGLVSARKTGLRAAKGLYIGFVDGDDYIAVDMYQSLVYEMEISKADFVHSGYWDNERKRVPYEKKLIETLGNKDELLEMVLLEPEKCGISYSIWSKLFKAELIQKSYAQVPDRCSYGEDIINLCVCIIECNKIALLNDAFYYYRARNDSLSHRYSISMLKNTLQLYEGLCDVLFSHSFYNDNIMNRFLWCELFKCMGRISRSDFRIAVYSYNAIDKLRGKKVVIYGAGMVGKDYYAQISRCKDCKIVAWVDRNPEKYHYPDANVDRVSILDNLDFDILIIAMENENTANKIRSELIKRCIATNKISWSKPCVYGPETLGEELKCILNKGL